MAYQAVTGFQMPANGTTYTQGQTISGGDANTIINNYPGYMQFIEQILSGATSAPMSQAPSTTILASTALTTAGTASANTQFQPTSGTKALELVIKTTAVTATPTLTILVQVPDGQGGWATAQTLTTSPTAAAETPFDLGPQGATPVDITSQGLKFVFTCSGSGAGITFLADVNQ